MSDIKQKGLHLVALWNLQDSTLRYFRVIIALTFPHDRATRKIPTRIYQKSIPKDAFLTE